METPSIADFLGSSSETMKSTSDDLYSAEKLVWMVVYSIDELYGAEELVWMVVHSIDELYRAEELVWMVVHSIDELYSAEELVWMVVHSLDELYSAEELHPPVLILPTQPVSIEIVHKLNYNLKKNII